ncbi:hypothetical protein R1flu_003470 [Riccia fluitans]|uniref:Uncharacterized protein n=1 Tax=Riccia fluitans TaxID=41844 RepID=A0ABD1Y954_9MARC
MLVEDSRDRVNNPRFRDNTFVCEHGIGRKHLQSSSAALEMGSDQAAVKMDILDFYKDAHWDIQELVICALAQDKRSTWSYDKPTRTITVESLHALRHDGEAEQQLSQILMAIWIGVVRKLVVETRFTTNITHWGYKYYDIQQELTDSNIRNWLLEYVPVGFPVEFVYNPEPIPE